MSYRHFGQGQFFANCPKVLSIYLNIVILESSRLDRGCRRSVAVMSDQALSNQGNSFKTNTRNILCVYK